MITQITMPVLLEFETMSSARWITKDNEIIHVSMLSNKHLLNSIRLFENALAKNLPENPTRAELILQSNTDRYKYSCVERMQSVLVRLDMLYDEYKRRKENDVL